MLTKRQKQTVVKAHQKHEKDSGSAEVQIGLLTKQITDLTAHLQKNPKDHHSRRGLLMMVGKRRRLLRYLKQENKKTFDDLVKKLGITVKV